SLTHPASIHTYPLSLHDALSDLNIRLIRPKHFPILLLASKSVFRVWRLAWFDQRRCRGCLRFRWVSISFTPMPRLIMSFRVRSRSEEHTSELQSRFDLVCRLLLE